MMKIKHLTTLVALAAMISGCIVSEDAVVSGGAEAGTTAGTTAGAMAGVTAGTVMGGTDAPPPCDPSESPTFGEPIGDPPQPTEAPDLPPEDCRSYDCGVGMTCELTNEVERCEEYPPLDECWCDEELGEVVCQTVSPAPYCYTEVTYECVPLVAPPPPVEECNGTPNPSVTCLQTGCDEGFTCVPTDDEGCVPSTCSCDEEEGVWACTADCGQSFGCMPAE